MRWSASPLIARSIFHFVLDEVGDRRLDIIRTMVEQYHKRRKTLQKKMTRTEQILFDILLDLPINFSFQRYFKDKNTKKRFYVDFFLRDYLLVIEADGGIHHTTGTYDTERDLLLMNQRFGNIPIVVSRFNNEEIVQNTFYETLKKLLEERKRYLLSRDWKSEKVAERLEYLIDSSWKDYAITSFGKKERRLSAIFL